MYTLIEISRILGVSGRTVTSLVKEGYLQTQRKNPRSQHFVAPSELLRYQEQHPTLPKLQPQKQYQAKRTDPRHTIRGTSEYKAARLLEAQEMASKRGGVCLSTEYLTRSHLLFKCTKDHVWGARFDNIKKGRWCKKCFNECRPKKLR
jgi:hypothetical protein